MTNISSKDLVEIIRQRQLEVDKQAQTRMSTEDILAKIRGRQVYTTELDNKLPDVSGVTNSANPKTVADLIKAVRASQVAQDVAIPEEPRQPTKRMPVIEGVWKRMGERMGICPYELKAVMTTEFQEDDELAFSLLKKFVTGTKLSNSVDLTGVHNTLKEAETNFQNETAWYQKLCKERQEAKDRAEKQRRTAAQNFTNAWGAILIELVQKVQRNPTTKGLGEWDVWLIRAIAKKGKEFASISRKGDVAIDFKACRFFSEKQVLSVLSNVREQQKEAAEAVFIKEVKKMSDWQLTEALGNEKHGSRRYYIIKSEMTDRMVKAGHDPYKRYDPYDDPYDDWGRGKKFLWEHDHIYEMMKKIKKI